MSIFRKSPVVTPPFKLGQFVIATTNVVNHGTWACGDLNAISRHINIGIIQEMDISENRDTVLGNDMNYRVNRISSLDDCNRVVFNPDDGSVTLSPFCGFDYCENDHGTWNMNGSVALLPPAISLMLGHHLTKHQGLVKVIGRERYNELRYSVGNVLSDRASFLEAMPTLANAPVAPGAVMPRGIVFDDLLTDPLVASGLHPCQHTLGEVEIAYLSRLATDYLTFMAKNYNRLISREHNLVETRILIAPPITLGGPFRIDIQPR